MSPALFPPTEQAARQRLAAVDPPAYARTRNHIDGAVTRLSPYITHGFLNLREVASELDQRHRLVAGHKLVFELGWRAYFHHVWRHIGEGIFRSLHAGPLPEPAYAMAVPEDVRQALTGVPVIDQAVRSLYQDGWLHNHARMWLASYLVHVRKVHWRAGADWLYAHLLDGDLASNHLSWQWVAGTGSSKPYLFNADNVARFAPADWHSGGSVIDTGYDTLERWARSEAQGVCTHPPAATSSRAGVAEPHIGHTPPPGVIAITTPDPEQFSGRDVWLVHPWALRSAPQDMPPSTLRLGVLDADFHGRWGWSDARWRFVLTRMAELTPQIGWAPAAQWTMALKGARSVRTMADPHLFTLMQPPIEGLRPRPLFQDPPQRCGSFSAYWKQVSSRFDRLSDLLEAGTNPTHP